MYSHTGSFAKLSSIGHSCTWLALFFWYPWVPLPPPSSRSQAAASSRQQESREGGSLSLRLSLSLLSLSLSPHHHTSGPLSGQHSALQQDSSGRRPVAGPSSSRLALPVSTGIFPVIFNRTLTHSPRSLAGLLGSSRPVPMGSTVPLGFVQIADKLTKARLSLKIVIQGPLHHRTSVRQSEDSWRLLSLSCCTPAFHSNSSSFTLAHATNLELLWGLSVGLGRSVTRSPGSVQK